MDVVIVSGISVGSMYAIMALGLVLEYRFSRVLNLAHGGQAVLAAYTFNATRGAGRGLAFVLGVAVAGISGLLIEFLVGERLRRSSEFIKMLGTLGFLLALVGGVKAIWGGVYVQVPSLVSPQTLAIGGVRISYDQLLLAFVGAAVSISVIVALKYTALGIRVRAVGERPVLAETLGVDSVRLARQLWTVGGMVAGIAGILVMPILNLDVVVYSLIVITAYSAVLIGGMENVGRAALGGLLIGLIQALANYKVHVIGVPEATVLAVALVVLLLAGSKLSWTEREEAV